MSSTEEAKTAKEAGAAAWTAGDFNLAVGEWTKAIDCGGDNDFLKVIYSNRSAAYLKLKQNSSALIDADKCISLDASWVKGITRKGDALYALGKFTDAYNTYNNGLRFSPNDKSLQEKSEQAMRALRGPSEDGSNASRGTASPSGGNVPTTATGLSGKILGYSRLFIFINALFYFVAGFFSKSIGLNCYRIFAVSSIVTQLLTMFHKFGMPKFNMEYASRIVPDPLAMQLFLSILLVTSRPYVLAMAPILLEEATHYTSDFLQYGQRNLPQMENQILPLLARFAPQIAQSSNPRAMLQEIFSSRSLSNINYQLTVASASTAVYQGIFLVVELVLPSRNIMLLFLWWQYLQMRYMLDRVGHLKSAFRKIDGQIVGLLSNRLVPPTVLSLYRKLTDILAKQAQPPSAGAANGGGLSSMLSKCSIM